LNRQMRSDIHASPYLTVRIMPVYSLMFYSYDEKYFIN